MKIIKEEFWITNISDKNVSLADLGLSIKTRTSLNLLDDKHFCYTPEQIEKSANEGSLHKKRDKIKIRIVKPEKPLEPGIRESNVPRFMLNNNKLRSLVKIEEPKFEELSVTEENFADEMTKDDV